MEGPPRPGAWAWSAGTTIASSTPRGTSSPSCSAVMAASPREASTPSTLHFLPSTAPWFGVTSKHTEGPLCPTLLTINKEIKALLMGAEYAENKLYLGLLPLLSTGQPHQPQKIIFVVAHFPFHLVPYRVHFTPEIIQTMPTACGKYKMEGGRCLSDYVEIYDGPLNSSPLLGKICSGYYHSYTSSSNLLTVRFHSNSQHTYRGFQASYYSTPADDSTTLLCLPNYMHVVVSRYFLQSHGYSAWNLTLNDPFCTPNITSNSVVFDIPYTRCGTVREGNNDTIRYSNVIRGSSSGTLITRNRNLLLHVNCKMLQSTWAKTMYIADDNFEVNETQYERYKVNLTFYDSSSFSRPVYDSPYHVKINQNLYLEASLHSSDPSLELFLDTCVASPTRQNFTRSYAIIKNGCVKDPTYSSYYSPYRHTLRFKFNAFQFVRSNPEVYLQCEMVVCRTFDYSSRCHQGCVQRSKRETSSDQEESVIVVAGPIQLWEPGSEIGNRLGSK